MTLKTIIRWHRKSGRRIHWPIIVAFFGIAVFCSAQTNQVPPTQSPSQSPETAPQVKEILPSYEGQMVTSVELAGQPTLNTEDLTPLLVQKAGEAFSPKKIDDSIAALKKVGRFQTVELEVLPESHGVRVLFVLQPASYIGMFLFPGARGYSYPRLLQVTNYPPRGAFSSYDVTHAQHSLVNYFRRTGYFESEVHPQLQPFPKAGLVNVIFQTTLGRRARFGEVIIQGTTPDEAQRLKGRLRSIVARLRGDAIRPGRKFKLKTLEGATQYLQNTLTKQGYLAAAVQLQGAKYDPQTNRADVTFDIQQGSLVNVRVEGAHLWSWTKRRLLPVYQQVGVNSELIQEGKQDLISYFQSKGFFNAEVTTKVSEEDNVQTIVYQINRGPRHRVVSVAIEGNEHIPDSQLMPHVTVNRARRFISHGKYSQQLVRESATNISNIYKSNGFSEVKVNPVVERPEGNVAVIFHVQEGRQDIVQSFHIEGSTVPLSELAPNGLNIAVGKPYSQQAVVKDRNQIMARYLEKGYLNANFHERINTLGHDKHSVQVIYRIEEGPQVKVANIHILGRERTQEKVITRNTAAIRTGEPLRQNDLLFSESRLYEPNIFDWARVEPRAPITTQTEDDVVIKVHEAARHQLTYGFGFEVINRGGNVPSGTVALPGLPPVGLPQNFRTAEQTFWGPRGTAQYTINNVRGKAESMTFSALAGRLDQRGSFIYSDPSFLWSSWSASASALGEHNSENPLFTSVQEQISLQFLKPLNAKKTRLVFFNYTFTHTSLTRILLQGLIPPEDENVRLSGVSATYTHDTRDNAIDARRGIYESYEFDLNPSVLGSNVNFIRLRTQDAYYKPLPWDKMVWANSLRFGVAQAFAGSHVPVSEKFFSGGGSTLRGFPLDGAGPQHPVQVCPGGTTGCNTFINVPSGGNQLLILNTELRAPILANLPLVHNNLEFAAFYDGGNVFGAQGIQLLGGGFSNSIGGGIRYHTPIGPIRLDVGHNLNPPPGIKSLQVFVTLGQAF